jgi:hypothetical protein
VPPKELIAASGQEQMRLLTEDRLHPRSCGNVELRYGPMGVEEHKTTT